jgi:hypothetical protein
VSITWTRTLAIPFNFSGCGVQGVTCLGAGRILATLEEVGGPTGTVLRTFLSADNGQTWAEGTELDLVENLSQARIRTMAFDTVLAGMTGPQTGAASYEAQGSVIARTTDAGATWGAAVTLTDYTAMFPNTATTDFWQAADFVKLAGESTVLAPGAYTSVGNAAIYLTSTDGGVTFNNPRNIAGSFGVFGGVSMGGGVVVFCDTSHNPARVWRSIDSGGSWTQVNLPGAGAGATFGATAIGPLANQRLGVVGSRASAGVAFFSADNGVSWTQATVGGSAQGGNDMVAPDGTHVVLGMDVTGAQITAGNTPFRLSTDGGATYPDSGTINAGTPLVNGIGYRVLQLAIADDGTVIAAVQTTDLTNTHPNELWRGVISGLVVDGPCVPLTPPTPPGPVVGLAGPRVECVPIFSPVCLVECPPDPVQPEGLRLAPSAHGGGFLSPLFILGLVSGTGGALVATGQVGVSTVCGATFANNYCAVAGC